MVTLNRGLLCVALLWQVCVNSHWSVSLCLTLLFVRAELEDRAKRIRRAQDMFKRQSPYRRDP